MKYKILRKKIVIASFVYMSDRDICLAALQEEYPDCRFDSQDETEKEGK